ncbi:MAG TPA: SpoIIE family protein phosphatase [Spirochaetota bacterium]|nr:SpoIIE family protein phosphatase [Spirochaetota bacterium]
MNTISIFVSLAASAMIIFTVVFVLVKDWQDQVMRYFAVFAASALGILFTMFLTYSFPEDFDLTLMNKITQLSTLMTFSSLFCMSFVFPKTARRFPFWKSFIILIPAIAMGATVVLTDFTITKAYFKDGKFIRDFNKDFPGYTIYAAMAFIYVLSALGGYVRKYIITKEYIYRLQMRYLFVGSTVSITLASVFSIIMPAFFGYTQLYVIGPSIASFFTIISLFYSIIAYNMLDIRTVVHKTFVYTVISMVISLPIFGILWAYYRKLWLLGEVPYYLVAGGVIAVFILFSVYIQPFIDRVFKRKQYAFGTVVDNFVRDIADEKNLPDIVRRTVDTLREGLSLTHAFFILLNDQTRKYELFYYKGNRETPQLPSIERNAPIIRWFVRNQDILQLSRVYTDDKSFGEVREEISSFFNDNGIQVILPVYHERRVVGLLCLGMKETLAGYHTDEIDKLKQFYVKSSDFISTALTYQKAMQEQLVTRTIDISSRIISSAVPPSLPNIGNIKFGAFIIPKYAQGGDYFDFIRPGDQGVGIVATDISGVGVNSALYSVLLRSAFQSSVLEAPSTSTVIGNMNRVLCDYGKGRGEMVTAYYLYYDIKSMRLMYTNAGYPALEIFRIEKNNFDSFDTEGIPLGYDPSATYGIGRTNLVRGDIGILYSKTLTTSKNQKGEEYGLLKLRNTVMEFRTRGAADIAAQIKNSFVSFMGLLSPTSDVVVIVFKIV